MRYITGTILLAYCMFFEALSFWAIGRPLYSIWRVTWSAFQEHGLAIFQNATFISLLPTVAVALIIFLLIPTRIFFLCRYALGFYRGAYLLWWALLAEAGMFCSVFMQYVHPDTMQDSVRFVTMPSFCWTVLLILVPGFIGAALERRKGQ